MPPVTFLTFVKPWPICGCARGRQLVAGCEEQPPRGWAQGPERQVLRALSCTACGTPMRVAGFLPARGHGRPKRLLCSATCRSAFASYRAICSKLHRPHTGRPSPATGPSSATSCTALALAELTSHWAICMLRTPWWHRHTVSLSLSSREAMVGDQESNLWTRAGGRSQISGSGQDGGLE